MACRPLADTLAATRAAWAARQRRPVTPLPFGPDAGTDWTEYRERSWWERVPAALGHPTLDDLTGPVADDLAAWAATDDPTNLVLLGPTGVGKTHAVFAAAWPRYQRGSTFTFAPVAEFLDRLAPTRPDRERQLRVYVTVGVLVLDDLGTERPTPWAAEQLYQVVNRRWLDRLPVVATSNLPPTGPESIGTVLGERLFSRLVGGAVVLRLTGPDRRRA